MKKKDSFWWDALWWTLGLVGFYLIYNDAKESEKGFVGITFLMIVFNIILLTKLDRIEKRLEDIYYKDT